MGILLYVKFIVGLRARRVALQESLRGQKLLRGTAMLAGNQLARPEWGWVGLRPRTGRNACATAAAAEDWEICYTS
jgi:hypothetical protein